MIVTSRSPAADLIHGLDRVEYQVDDDLLDLHAVHQHHDRVGVQGELNLRIVPAGVELQQPHDVAQQIVQIDRRPAGPLLADELAHLADDFAGPVRLIGDLLHPVRRFRRHRAGAVASTSRQAAA